MEREKIAENEINILDMLFVIRKNIIAIVVVAVVLAMLSLVYTLTMVVPMYSSTTQLLIKGISNEAMSIYPDSTSRVMLVNNSMEVLHGTEVMHDVIDRLSLDLTPEELQRNINISSPADTQVLKITAYSADPALAKDIASAMSDISNTVLAETVGISALSVIQVAKTPTAPVSPNPIKNTIMGGFLGGVLATAFFILMWFINNRIYTPEDAQKALGLTVFASVPFIESQDNTTENQEQKKDKKSKTEKKSKGGKR